jgi:hypothetical protein
MTRGEDTSRHPGRQVGRQKFGGDRPTKLGQTTERITGRTGDDGELADRGPVIFPNNGAYQVHAQAGGVQVTAHNSTDGMTDPHARSVYKRYVGMGVGRGPHDDPELGHYQHITEHIPTSRPDNWPADVEGHPDWK